MTVVQIERAEPVPPTAPPTLAGRLRSLCETIRPIWAVNAVLDEPRRQGVYDLELAVRILNLPEWLEWCRTHGDETQARFAAEAQEAVDDAELVEHATATMKGLDKALNVQPRQNTVGVAVEIRQALVDAGALGADDHETDIPGLIRMLIA
jgi:hypothetical protein